MKTLSIGQMARINNISIQALRLYDEMGILKPIAVNAETGYRYYDIRQSAQLDMISYMKATGMSLKEIKKVFEHRDLYALTHILESRLAGLDTQIAVLVQQKKAIGKMIGSYNRYLSSPENGTCTLEFIEERRYYATKTEVNVYDFDLGVYESELKNLKDKLVRANIPQFYYYNVGTTICASDFLEGRIKSDDIFVFVDNELHNSELKSIPAGMFACVYSDGFDAEKTHIKRLWHFLDENNLNVSGDYICEVLCELPYYDSNKREMFLRLQIPVAFRKNM